MSQEKAQYILTKRTYKTLFNDLYIPLCLFANTYVKQPATAEDLVQEVFIKIWEDQVQFKNENTIRAYMYTAVRNRSINFVKSKYQQSTGLFTTEEIELMETDSFFIRETVFIETISIINKALGTLPGECAKIIRLSLNDYTNKEIAEELSLSINTVKTQKKIAYRKLRPLLKDSLLLILLLFDS